MKKMLKYLKPFKKQIILGPMFKIIEAIFELIVPLVMAYIIDKGIGNNDSKLVLKMSLVLVGLAVVGLLSTLVCQRMAAYASQGYGTLIRNELFQKINTLSYQDLDKFGSETLITRITSDVNQLSLAVAMLIRLVIRAPFLVIGATIMASTINKSLALIFLLAAIFIATILYLIMSRSIPHYKKIQKNLDEVSLITQENLQGARVIRAFSKQKVEEERFNKTTLELEKNSINVGKISALLNPFTYVVVNLAIIAILWFGGKQVYNGSLSQGEVVALVNYMTQIMLALIVVANLIVIFTKASTSLIRVNEVSAIKSDIIEGNVDNVQKNEQVIIEYKNVCFKYHQDTSLNVLNNISFKIKRGETIGIIGVTGSGKTTLINLLLRFYEPNSGSIIYNGRNIKEYTFKTIRENISVVPQNSTLLTGTIRSNMCMKKNANEEEILKALEIAQAKDFVLEKGLDSNVNQGGKNFSGGMKQRLAIARSLIGSPDILILDDSSSALDYATDAKLRKSLRENLKDLTMIVISQRATTLMKMDNIIVLEDGNIKGIGTHEELLNTSSTYKEIYESQFSRGDEDER